MFKRTNLENWVVILVFLVVMGCATAAGGTWIDDTPLYRFWAPVTSRHFYTIEEAEKDKLISIYAHVWTYEGIVYYAFETDSELGLMPVYRFWSPVLVAHFYTISESEKQKLLDRYPHVWTYEGITFYVYAPGEQPVYAKPVYRFWSPVLETHFYTISGTEKNKLIDNYPHLWVYEGVAWHAYEYSPSPPIPVEVDIDPDTLNIESEGNWITCYIWFPEEYNVADVDPDTILLNGEIDAAWSWFEDDEQLLMVKFPRSEVQEIVQPGDVELTVSGELSDGTIFKGTDTIRVID